MKLFKATIENLYKVILMIIISSAIICFFNVVMAKFIIYVQCEDKYNEEHNYEISGVYYAKIPYPNFEIKEIEKQSKVL